MKSFILALSTLVGTIVGAGIFGIPYAISKSGLIPGVFYFVVLGGVVCLLHLLFGEVCLRTSQKHRLVGYAQMYLGQWGRVVASIVLFIVLGGALLAYLIIAGDFLKIIFPFLPFSSAEYSLLFLLFCSFFIFQGIQLIAKLELAMNLMLVAVIGVMFLLMFPSFDLANLFSSRALRLPSNFADFFLPYGVLLFAMAGWDAIPEIAEFFKGRLQKRNLDNVIVWASVITVGLYVLFSFFVVGVSGSDTSPDALSGLESIAGKEIAALGALFGMFAIATSFLILGNYFKNSLRYDFHIPYVPALAVAMGVPLLLFLLGFQNFINVIGIVGSIMGAAEGILLILIFQRAKTRGDRAPEYSISVPRFFVYGIALALLGGAVAVIVMRIL